MEGQTSTASSPSDRCPVVHLAEYDGSRPPLAGHVELDALRSSAAVVQVEVGNPYVFQQGKPFLLVTRYAEIRDVAQRASVFSNRPVGAIEGETTGTEIIPEGLDGDIHLKWRRLIAPEMSPKRVLAMDEAIRKMANDFIDEFIDAGECDFIEDFASKFPTSVFLRLFGLPAERLGEYLEWKERIKNPGSGNMKGSASAQAEVSAYFRELIVARRAAGYDAPDDLLNRAVHWQIDDAPISEDDLTAFCLLMFQAGLDTVTSVLGYCFLHLATHASDRERIVQEPGIIGQAVEELMRVYGMISPPRTATEDTTIGTCPVAKGEQIALSYPSAGRDEGVFSDATTVDFDRQKVTHFGFGAGPHRCLGSHLARHELMVAMEVWHERIPVYEVAPGTYFDERVTEIFGLNNLPLVWDPTARRGA